MKKRCDNVDCIGYKDYGGRGITYQDSWSNFAGFWNDMGDTYQDHLTLERKDVNGNYGLTNCIWVTKAQQARNKRGYSNNQLGIPNTKLIMNKGIETLQVRIQNPSSGKRVMRWFSLKLYDYDEALLLAREWLNLKRNEFGYEESHGSER